MCDFSKAVWILSAQGNDFQPWQTCQFGFSSAAIKLSFCEVLVNFFYRPPCNVSSNSIWVLQGSRRLQYCSARSFFAWSWRHSLLLLDVTQEMLEKTPGGFSFSLFLHWHAFFFFCGGQTQRKRCEEICKYCWFFTAKCSTNGMNSEYAVYWLSQHFLLFS